MGKILKEALEKALESVKGLSPAAQKKILESIPGLAKSVEESLKSYAKLKTPSNQIPSLLKIAAGILGLGYLIEGGLDKAGQGLNSLFQPILIFGGLALVGAIVYKKYG